MTLLQEFLDHVSRECPAYTSEYGIYTTTQSDILTCALFRREEQPESPKDSQSWSSYMYTQKVGICKESEYKALSNTEFLEFYKQLEQKVEPPADFTLMYSELARNGTESNDNMIKIFFSKSSSQTQSLLEFLQKETEHRSKAWEAACATLQKYAELLHTAAGRNSRTPFVRLGLHASRLFIEQDKTTQLLQVRVGDADGYYNPKFSASLSGKKGLLKKANPRDLGLAFFIELLANSCKSIEKKAVHCPWEAGLQVLKAKLLQNNKQGQEQKEEGFQLASKLAKPLCTLINLGILIGRGGENQYVAELEKYAHKKALFYGYHLPLVSAKEEEFVNRHKLWNGEKFSLEAERYAWLLSQVTYFHRCGHTRSPPDPSKWLRLLTKYYYNTENVSKKSGLKKFSSGRMRNMVNAIQSKLVEYCTSKNHSNYKVEYNGNILFFSRKDNDDSWNHDTDLSMFAFLYIAGKTEKQKNPVARLAARLYELKIGACDNAVYTDVRVDDVDELLKQTQQLNPYHNNKDLSKLQSILQLTKSQLDQKTQCFLFSCTQPDTCGSLANWSQTKIRNLDQMNDFKLVWTKLYELLQNYANLIISSQRNENTETCPLFLTWAPSDVWVYYTGTQTSAAWAVRLNDARFHLNPNLMQSKPDKEFYTSLCKKLSESDKSPALAAALYLEHVARIAHTWGCKKKQPCATHTALLVLETTENIKQAVDAHNRWQEYLTRVGANDSVWQFLHAGSEYKPVVFGEQCNCEHVNALLR